MEQLTDSKLERSLLRLYIFTLLIQILCRVHHVKHQAGWITSWNEDCQEKYKKPQTHRWYHSNGRKQRGTKEPFMRVKVKVLVTQLCLTLCNPMDCSLPVSSVHGILQARILEWVAIPFSRASFQARDRTHVYHVAGRFFTVWAIKEDSEKADLKLNIQKTKVMAFGSITSCKQMGKKW